MLRLFTDTDTDITPARAAEYGYSLISMPYSVDGETVYPWEDYSQFDFHAFYDRLRGGVLPTTSAISAERYRAYFEPVFAAGDDILYVHFSAAMTATFRAMDEAVADLLAKYPDRHFYAVDTKGITTVSLLQVIEIGELYQSGATAREIMAAAPGIVEHTAMYFFADDLKFFRRSGRVSGIAATMGNMIGIRPIIYMSEEGKMVSVGKERGRERAIARLLSYVDELGDDLPHHRILIGHTDAPQLAAEIEARLREKLGPTQPIETVPVNPTAGSHCGPDGVGICFHSIHR